MTLHQSFRFSFLALAGTLILTSCGAGSRSTNPRNLAATAPEKLALNGESSHDAMTASPTAAEQIPGDDAPTNPGAKFLGCWYKAGAIRYQAVDVSVTKPGTYPFNAKLYYGTTCDPSTQADQFGFGQEIQFGDFGYIFWFDAFGNKTDMSATWQVGSDISKCMNYKTAPACP